MKKFKFRLQPVLKLRQQLEDQKKRVVGSLQTEIARQQQEALDMADQVKQQGQLLKQQFIQGKVDVRWISYYQSYVGTMYRSIAQKIDHVKETQTKLSGARAQLAQAAKETKILEKLKEKQNQRFGDHIHRLEKYQMDEMSTQIFYRNQKKL